MKTWANGDIAGAADLQRWEDAGSSLARTAHAPGLGLYFPEAEGAVADGVTNDQPAIAAAFTAAPAGAQVVLAPGKRYAIASSVTPKSSTVLNGNGATLKWTGAGDQPLFLNAVSDVRVSDLTVDCGSTPPNSAVYVSSGSDKIDLSRVTVINPTTTRTAFNLVGATNTNVDYCDVQGGGIAYNITGGSKSCKLTHCTASGVTAGVQITPGASAAPSDIDVDYFTITEWPTDENGNVNAVLSFPMRSVGGTTLALRNKRIRFRWCTILGPSRGYIDTVTPGGTADQINAIHTDVFTVIGCISMFGGDMGISFTDSTIVNIIGNTTNYNTAGGITCSTGCSFVTISGNIAMNNGQNWDNHAPDATSRFGIGSRASDNVNIADNVVGDNQATPTQNYGVRLLAATDTGYGGDNISVGPNIYKGNALAPFYSDGTQTNLDNRDTGGGADVFGKRAVYASITANAVATIATASTWTPFNAGSPAPSITLPNDGGIYRIDLHGKAATMSPAATLSFGLSGDGGASRFKIAQHNHTDTNARDRVHVVAGNVVGSGQTITVLVSATAPGTATIVADTIGGLCELWATRIG